MKAVTMIYGFGTDPPKFPDALQNVQTYSLYSVTKLQLLLWGYPRLAQQQLNADSVLICNNKMQNVKNSLRKKNLSLLWIAVNCFILST